MPILLLQRERLRFLPEEGSGYRYQRLESGRLDMSEILRTYFQGWVVLPALLFFPLLPLPVEIWRDRLHLPEGGIHIAAILVWLAWLVYWSWKLMDQFDAARRP